jgi:Tol biopolymer transport system component
MMVFLLIFALNTITVADIQFEPGFNWFTIETGNFVIHFPAIGLPDEQRLELVRQVAVFAEEIRETVRQGGVRVPAAPVQIVITDYYDLYNGYATPFPDNTIVILPFPPVQARANDDHWLRTLLLHEFAHICQLEQCRGFPRLIQRLMGRIALPNALLPAWLLEGYAVYNETRFSSMGRLRSSEWRCQLLNLTAAGRIPEPDRCNHYALQRYPAGLAPYLFGSSFIQFCAERFGPGVWDDFNYIRAARLPFCEEPVARKVFHQPVSRLWNEWRDWIIGRAESLQQAAGSVLTEIRRLTYEGFNTGAPIWSPTGAGVYYISANGQEETAIKELMLGTMTTRTVHRGAISGNLGISPDGRYLVWAELVAGGSGYQQRDLFIYDLEQGKISRLTRGERAIDPDFAPDTSHIVYVSNREGISRLKILNWRTGEQQVVAELKPPDYFHQPRFSPGGNLIAVSVWRTGGYADIEVIDLKTGWVLPITSDRANDINPCWSRTGKFLFFISDRNGVNNLYAYGAESRKLYQCTRVLTGVFQPAVAPDNQKIALVILTPEGYDIGLIKLTPQNWQVAEEYSDTLPEMKYQQAVLRMTPVYYYSPFPTVLPKFWVPWLTVGEEYSPGIMTLGWDVLQFHRYRLFAGYRFRGKTPLVNFVYELHRYRPVLEFSGNLTFRRQDVRLGVSLPVVRVRNWQNAGLGMRFVNERQPELTMDGFYQFSNARLFRFNVAPVQGRNFGFLTDVRTGWLLSGAELFRVAGFWQEYLGKPPANWSLRSRLVLASAFGDTVRHQAFRITNKPGLLMVRGVQDCELTGARALVAGLELRVPVLWVEHGRGLMPFFLQNINAAVFSEGAMVSSDLRKLVRGWDAGAGIEFRADMLIGHYLPVKFTIGLAISVRTVAHPEIYLRLDSELLKEISGDKTGLRLEGD